MNGYTGRAREVKGCFGFERGLAAGCRALRRYSSTAAVRPGLMPFTNTSPEDMNVDTSPRQTSKTPEATTSAGDTPSSSAGIGRFTPF